MVICGTLMQFFCNFSVDREPTINPLIRNLLLWDVFASMQQHNAIKKTDLSKPSHPLSVFGITSYNQETLLIRNGFIKILLS